MISIGILCHSVETDINAVVRKDLTDNRSQAGLDSCGVRSIKYMELTDKGSTLVGPPRGTGFLRTPVLILLIRWVLAPPVD